MILYYSSPITRNTERLASKLGQAVGMSIRRVDDTAIHPLPNEPHYLAIPTYGSSTSKPVPAQVVQFLNRYEGRASIRGVIGAGNRNFGEHFCAAAFVVARKLQVPVIGVAELEGQPLDMEVLIPKLQEAIRLHSSGRE